MRPAIRGIIAVALVMCGLLVPAAQAGSFPVTGTTWADATDLLPAVVPDPRTGFDPSSSNPCISGRTSCVRQVINQLSRRFMGLARTCSHNAIFALAYLRVTQSELASMSWTPALFSDRPYINYMDGVFASYYMRAYDRWAAGLPMAPAWRIALQAAKEERVPAANDLSLAMVAHILNDLPFVIYQSGMTAPDGSSRKPDYDAVNRFLYPITDPLYAEIARRFDPTISQQYIVPGTTVVPDSTFGLIAAWREQAWREAEQLAVAAGPGARRVVAQGIEAYAAQVATGIEQGTQYPPGSNAAAVRDAYCAQHWNDQ